MGGLIHPEATLDYVNEWWMGHVWCMVLTHWVCRFTQAALKPASGEKWHVAFLKALTGLGSAQWGIGRLSTGRSPVYPRFQFCLMLYLLLFEKRRKEKKK
jgi:hypothetical protein